MTSWLTLQFLKKEGLAAAPLSVQADTDRRLHGGLAQDVCQGAAVQVVTQHVPVRLGGREVLWGRQKKKTDLRKSSAVPARTASMCRKEHSKAPTGSKYLREDALLVGAVDVVRRLPCFVGSVEQAAVFGVPQQQLGQLPAPTPDGDVQRRVSFLGTDKSGRQKAKLYHADP